MTTYCFNCGSQVDTKATTCFFCGISLKPQQPARRRLEAASPETLATRYVRSNVKLEKDILGAFLFAHSIADPRYATRVRRIVNPDIWFAYKYFLQHVEVIVDEKDGLMHVRSIRRYDQWGNPLE